MASVTTAGGPGGIGGFRMRWRGAEVQRALDDATQEAMQKRALAMKNEMQARVHVITGLLKASITATVDARGGSARRTIVIEADAPYAASEVARGGSHDFMRPVIDRHAPMLRHDLRESVRRRAG
jgi:hypothetical protein